MSIVVCREVSKRYGSTLALDSVSLELQAGEPIALIGPNGAGKTTLMGAICGYTNPSAGNVDVFGLPPDSTQLLGRISALPQDAQFDPRFSVSSQLGLFARLQGFSAGKAKAEVVRVLHLVNLSGSGDSKPEQLSHGMRKRVAIAQAMIGNPEFVVLDEPTAGLDPESARGIRDVIHSVSGQATFLISSHNLDELEKLCRTVVYMEQGRLVKQTSLDDRDDDGYLTVKLLDVETEQAVDLLMSLPGVTDVQATPSGEYIIQYQSSTSPHLDQSILQLLAERNWRYRHLVRGRSLEEAFFAQR